MPGSSTAPRSSTLNQDGSSRAELEIGMPHTGQNNLTEGALIRELGHLRWRHIDETLGVRSRDLCDAEGNRLYATFFYIDVAFPPTRPMSSFGENDRISIVSTLRRAGPFAHGEHYLFPGEWPEERKAVPATLSESLAAGVPWVTMGNSFVKQLKGADWLKRANPAGDRFEQIPDVPIDEVLERLAQVKNGADFLEPEATYAPIVPPTETTYRIVPERDLNGAGLLYFANYPVIVDVCERQVLSEAFGDTDELSRWLSARALVRRRSGYFSNATYRDTLRVSISVSAKAEPKPSGGFDHWLLVTSRMRRESDNRLMYVSSALKRIADQTAADVPAAVAGQSATLRVASTGNALRLLELTQDGLVVVAREGGLKVRVGQGCVFVIETPLGQAECRGEIRSLELSAGEHRASARIVTTADGPLRQYAESSVLRQMYPLSSLKVRFQ